MTADVHESAENGSVLDQPLKRSSVIMKDERHIALQAELKRHFWVQRGQSA